MFTKRKAPSKRIQGYNGFSRCSRRKITSLLQKLVCIHLPQQQFTYYLLCLLGFFLACPKRSILELNWNQRLGQDKIEHLSSYAHVVYTTVAKKVISRHRKNENVFKMSKDKKILFFIVKYANPWGFCCRRGCSTRRTHCFWQIWKPQFLSVVQYNNTVYVLGHKYVLGPTQTHFSPSRQARAKMSLRRAQNIFMPKNINSITINITRRALRK